MLSTDFCTMPLSSNADDPLLSLRDGNPKRITALTPRSDNSSTSFARSESGCLLMSGIEPMSCAFFNPSSTKIGAIRSLTER